VVCALPRAVGTDELSHVDGLRRAQGVESSALTAPFYFLRGKDAAIASAVPLVQPYRETTLRIPVPIPILGRDGEALLVSLGDSYMCSVSHWVHALRVNTFAMCSWWVRRLRLGLVLGPAWAFWRLLCGFPWYAGRFAGAFNAISWSAKVHHDASLEFSVVQRRAKVGANATIRNSFIAEGATIGEGARVFGSVIGRDALVAPNSVVFMSVVNPRAMAGQLLMQRSLLGPEAGAFTNSNFFDVNLSRNVRVAHRGRLVDSGTQMLGVCVGPRARVAAGIWVASGREIPAGALLVKPPAEIANDVGRPAPDEPHIVVDGEVVPLSGAGRPRMRATGA
jgi:carbonic anhydrase/acetyltransferase-like protein (isoleucine patch superfamily)